MKCGPDTACLAEQKPEGGEDQECLRDKEGTECQSLESERLQPTLKFQL